MTHQLAQAVRDLQDYYVLAQTNYNRRAAAQREVDATTAAYEQGTATLNLVLDAQRRMAEAESDYFRSVTDYNESIIAIQKYKSSLLEYDGVTLAEGPWAQKAYFDAQKRADMRRRGKYINYGYTRPRVISRGPYNQQLGRDINPEGMTTTVAPAAPVSPSAPRSVQNAPAATGNSILSQSADVEMVPTPAPVEVHEVQKAVFAANTPISIESTPAIQQVSYETTMDVKASTAPDSKRWLNPQR